MKRIVLIALSMILICTMMLNLAGCGNNIKSQNLMKNITPQKVPTLNDFSDGNVSMTDFAVRLFKECEQSGKNTLISPLSVMYALAMTANGADGETLLQMEEVLGMPVNDLNNYFYSYKNSLPQGEKYKLNLANSIWISEAYNIKRDFLQANANYYGADIYKTQFGNAALKDINNWVDIKTDKMIPAILEKIDEDTVMYLINALAFDAEWETIYQETDVRTGTFTCEDATTQAVDFMYSNEGYYLQDEKARGFIKHYADEKYAFAALLPNKDITVSEYVNLLDGIKLNEMLSNSQSTIVNAAIPKFQIEYGVEMNNALIAMGMKDAFDLSANFNKMCRGVLIGNVLHKTYIRVDEKGTSAGAVTSVAINKKAIVRDEEKTVYLDRPFVYMIVDCENNVPIFIGTVMSV